MRMLLRLILRVLGIIIILPHTRRVRIRITPIRIIISVLIIISRRGCRTSSSLIGSLRVLVSTATRISIRLLVISSLLNRVGTIGAVGGIIIIVAGVTIIRSLAKDVFRAFMQLWAAYRGGTVVGGSEGL